MTDLRTLKVDELKNIAREYGISGIWKKTKNALIEDILTAAKQNGHEDKYFADESEAVQNESEEAQDVVENEVDEVIDEVEEDESEAIQDESEDEPKKPRGKLIEYNGKAQTLNKWAEELGFTPQTLYARLYISNWTVEKAFGTPSRRKKEEEA